MMEFSLNVLYELERELGTVFSEVLGVSAVDVDKSKVNVCKKDTLVNFVVHIAGMMDRNRLILRSAAVQIEELKSEQIQNQKSVIDLQTELIQSKGSQVEAVQETVKSEVKSFSDAVRQGCTESFATEKLEAVVKKAIKCDDRKRTLMFFGLTETSNEVLISKVGELLSDICSSGKPAVVDCHRVGAVKPETVRPVKVLFNSEETAVRVLKCSSSLKSTRHTRVYITPDRTPEERTERKRLVEVVKEKMVSEPQRYHFIRNGAVHSKDKETSTPRNVPVPPQSEPAKTPVRPASSQEFTATASPALSSSRTSGVNQSYRQIQSFQQSVTLSKAQASKKGAKK